MHQVGHLPRLGETIYKFFVLLRRYIFLSRKHIRMVTYMFITSENSVTNYSNTLIGKMPESGLSYMGFTVYTSRQCSNLVSGCENTNQNGGTSITAPSETINTLTRLISGRSALNMEVDIIRFVILVALNKLIRVELIF